MVEREGRNPVAVSDPPGEGDLGEPSMLGAAEPQIVGPPPRKGGGGGGSWRPKGPKPGWWLLVVPLLIIVLALTPAFISGLKKTPRNRIGISYGGGPFEATHFQRIVQPGSGLFFNGFFDPLYLYPSDQQNYIVSLLPGVGLPGEARLDRRADEGPRAWSTYQVAVYFKLNTDKLRAFHEAARSPVRGLHDGRLEQPHPRHVPAADRERAAGGDPPGTTSPTCSATQTSSCQLQNRVQKKISQRLQDAVGSRFFCAPTFQAGGKGVCGDPTFIIKAVDIPTSVTQAFQDNRTSAIQIQTKQNEIMQRQAEAQSIAALGLTGDQYDMLKAIESGKINFWVLPNNGGGVNIAGPGTTGQTPTTTTTRPK